MTLLIGRNNVCHKGESAIGTALVINQIINAKNLGKLYELYLIDRKCIYSDGAKAIEVALLNAKYYTLSTLDSSMLSVGSENAPLNRVK